MQVCRRRRGVATAALVAAAECAVRRAAAAATARFLTNPAMEHYQAAMRVLTYVSQSRTRRLRFAPDVTRGFEVYVDSSWATRFSCSGAMYFFHGSLFHWFSKMQHSVSLRWV